MHPTLVETDWPALAAARLRAVPRVPFRLGSRAVGSVARAHLGALERFERDLRVTDSQVELTAAAAQRDEILAHLNAQLHADGLIVAWRDEPFPLLDPHTGDVLATFERAATRFWGTMTRGAHCNGFVRGADGRPSHLWIARRSLTKATDPGKLDNLVGGGVPHGQTPHQTMVREGWEEAGLDAATMQRAQPGRVLYLERDIPEGCMVEQVHSFDLELPEGCTPCNQDGEVSQLTCMDIRSAAWAAARDEMTVDAALVTLDFLLRHGLLEPAEHERLALCAAPLFSPPAKP